MEIANLFLNIFFKLFFREIFIVLNGLFIVLNMGFVRVNCFERGEFWGILCW
jgi:hypothetical protein